MHVIDILRVKGRDVLFLPAEANMLDAAVLLASKRVGAVIIRDEAGKVAGILSERDVVRAIAQENVRAMALPVSAYMTRQVTTCTEADAVERLMGVMTEGRFRHIPVLDGEGSLCGLISIGDVVKSIVEESTREASNLREFIAAAG